MDMITELRWRPVEREGWGRQFHQGRVRLVSGTGTLCTTIGGAERIDWAHIEFTVVGRGLAQLFCGHKCLYEQMITNDSAKQFVDLSQLDQRTRQEIELILTPVGAADFTVPQMLITGRDSAKLLGDLLASHSNDTRLERN